MSDGFIPGIFLQPHANIHISFEDPMSLQAGEMLPAFIVKIIALTGWGQANDRMRSPEIGFDAHLLKPVDYEAMAKILAADIGPL